jgi:glycosyltransferase involved in cell wall biosynthesis
MIHGMMLVRNESGRWLEQVLKQMNQICDRVVILDDASTDNTVSICEEFGEVFRSNKQKWTTNELEARQKLWQLTTNKASDNDWILCLDADELFVDGHIDYIKYLFHVLPTEVDAVGFRLHDMWSDTHYRDDQLWQAHRYIWPMAVRYKERFIYHWLNKKLHCGRFPGNASQKCYPTMIPIKHMGWSREADRIKKHERYLQCDPDGKNGIMEQYISIMDTNPTLKLFGT